MAWRTNGIVATISSSGAVCPLPAASFLLTLFGLAFAEADDVRYPSTFARSDDQCVLRFGLLSVTAGIIVSVAYEALALPLGALKHVRLTTVGQVRVANHESSNCPPRTHRRLPEA